MSVQALSWAFETEAPSPTAKAVLVALANRHNHDTGRCCPHVARIATETQFSERAVRDALSLLVKSSLVARRRSRKDDGSLGGYTYTFPRLETPSTPAAGGAGRPAAGGAGQEPEEDLEPKDLSTASRSRAPDPVWDALVAVTGFTPTTTSERSDFGKTVRELRAVIPQTASDVDVLAAMRGRRAAWERHYDGARFTHRVLRGKWAELGALAVGAGVASVMGTFPELADGETF